MTDCIPTFFRPNMEMMRSMREEMKGKVFISCQSRYFPFIIIMIELLFPICALNWRVNYYVSCQEKGINTRNESTIIII